MSPIPRSPARRPHRCMPWAASLGGVVLALGLAGCATPMDPRKDAAFQERASVNDRPVVRPTRSISSFSDSLACMDQMLR